MLLAHEFHGRKFMLPDRLSAHDRDRAARAAAGFDGEDAPAAAANGALSCASCVPQYLDLQEPITARQKALLPLNAALGLLQSTLQAAYQAVFLMVCVTMSQWKQDTQTTLALHGADEFLSECIA